MPGGPDEFSATDIPSLPYSDLNSGAGLGDEFWYTYLPAQDGVLGTRARLTAGSGYSPILETYYGTPGTLDDYLEGAVDGTNGAPLAQPMASGVRVYFRIFNIGGSPSGAGVTFTAVDGDIAGAYSPGALFVNNEVAYEQPAGSDTFVPLAGTVLSPTDASVLRLVPEVPAGESGDIVASGRMLLANSYGVDLHLFDTSTTPWTLIATITPPLASSGAPVIGRFTDTSFMVATRNAGNTATVLWTVDEAGTIGDDTWTIPAGAIVWSFGVDPNLRRVYYATTSAASAPVKRFDLDAGAISDLDAGLADYKVAKEKILVLADSSVVVGYLKTTSPEDNLVRRYEANSLDVINTYELGATTSFGGGGETELDRIARGLDDPGSFWAWLNITLDDAFGNLAARFVHIDTETGSVIAPTPIEQYEQDAGIGAKGIADPPDFASSFSCTFVVMPGATSSPGSPTPGIENPPDGEIGPIAWVEEWEDAA